MSITWGVSGHPLWAYGSNMPIPKQMDMIRDLGLKSYRVDLNQASTHQMNVLSTLITEGKAEGIGILPILLPGVSEFQSESAAYSAAKALGSAYAAKFPG